MSLVFHSRSDDPATWRTMMARFAPGLGFHIWPDVPEPADIRYAAVWQPPEGLLAALPNLRAIFSLGAGVEHVLRRSDLPAGVPLFRLVDAGMAPQMAEYVLYGVLHFHRRMDLYRQQQQQAAWNRLPETDAGQTRVGLLGLGTMGRACAAALRPLGFQLRGWSRSPQQVEGVATFAGTEGLEPFLAGTDILVCLLPLTAETEGLLNATTLSQLPHGACLINAGRGRQMVAEDLLAALDRGQLRGALLDVFEPEPLPPKHPFWQHPAVTVTPHIASRTLAEPSARQIAEAIAVLERGGTPPGLVDRGRGY